MMWRFRFLLVLCLSVSPVGAVESWPEFRGPTGNGHATGSKPPTQWSETQNVRWKTAIHGRGWSSPVVYGQQIWMTTASEDGKKMYAVCVDRQTGNIVHDLLVFENEEPRFCHPTNSYASPTPVVEPGRVYVHFGSYGTACLDSQTGQMLWQRRDLPCDHFRGPGSSPILHGGRLYIAYDGFDLQYVAALDKETGETVWRRDRGIDYGTDNGDFKKAYSTAAIVHHDGKAQLISPSAMATISYDPATGEELWRVKHGGMNAALRPVSSGRLVYLTTGDMHSALLAVAVDGRGDITTTHVAWESIKSAAKRPSPLLIDGYVYQVNDDGVASCLSAETGETVWQKRLGGAHRASPIYADGRIYFFDLEGDMPVIQAGPHFKLLARNQLEEGCQASPAVVDDALIIRTIHHLYCIEKAEE